MNAVPFIRSGVGASPADGGCILQVVSWIHNEGWTDDPPCVHPVIRRLAIVANDNLPDGERQKLLDLIPRMMGTASDDHVLSVRLAITCAKVVLPIFEEKKPDNERPRKAIQAAEAWCECPCEAHARQARNAAHAANAAGAYAADAAAAYNADAAAYSAAHAAHAAANATAAAYSAAHATALAGAFLYDLLTAVLDEYDLRTGRGAVAPVDLSPVVRMLAEVGA